MKKFRVKDLDGFENSVFGADDLLELFPALTTSGVSLVQQGSNHYVTDSKGNIVSDCTFFSEEEMQFLEEII